MLKDISKTKSVDKIPSICVSRKCSIMTMATSRRPTAGVVVSYGTPQVKCGESASVTCRWRSLSLSVSQSLRCLSRSAVTSVRRPSHSLHAAWDTFNWTHTHTHTHTPVTICQPAFHSTGVHNYNDKWRRNHTGTTHKQTQNHGYGDNRRFCIPHLAIPRTAGDISLAIAEGLLRCDWTGRFSQ